MSQHYGHHINRKPSLPCCCWPALKVKKFKTARFAAWIGGLDIKEELEKANVEFRTESWLPQVIMLTSVMVPLVLILRATLTSLCRLLNQCWFCTATTTPLCLPTLVRDWWRGRKKQVVMMVMEKGHGEGGNLFAHKSALWYLTGSPTNLVEEKTAKYY